MLDYGNTGYIYFYGTNISLCVKTLNDVVKGSLEEIITYCSSHKLKATIVLTKLRFWKNKQLKLNKMLYEADCHMDKETILKLYECNAYILKQTADWQKNWADQPIFKAASSGKKSGIDFRDLFSLFG